MNLSLVYLSDLFLTLVLSTLMLFVLKKTQKGNCSVIKKSKNLEDIKEPNDEKTPKMDGFIGRDHVIDLGVLGVTRERSASSMRTRALA